MRVEVATKRKLIDIEEPVFDALTVLAKGRKVSLKRYIEELLKEEVREKNMPKVDGVTDERILRLLGAAKSIHGAKDDADDERLQYILSK